MTTAETKYDKDTESFAAANGVKGHSVRARMCRTGSYFGITPMKLANGRLLWPDVQLGVEKTRAK
jgi:hypothetical protein